MVCVVVWWCGSLLQLVGSVTLQVPTAQAAIHVIPSTNTDTPHSQTHVLLIAYLLTLGTDRIIIYPSSILQTVNTQYTIQYTPACRKILYPSLVSTALAWLHLITDRHPVLVEALKISLRPSYSIQTKAQLFCFHVALSCFVLIPSFLEC